MQVIVAADQSSESWQEKADFRCRDEVDDAVVLNAAAEAAAEAKEKILLAPGYYRSKSCWEIPTGVMGVEAAGQVYLMPRDDYDGWLMRANKLQRFARIEGLGFIGQQQAKGLLVDDSHHCTVDRLHFSGVIQALKVKKGWYVHVRTILVSDCFGGNGPRTKPLVDLQQFSVSSVRGLVINRCMANAPMLSVAGKATCEDIDVEKCESIDAPIIRFSGTHNSLSRLHFEENRAPVQVEAVDCRQCDLGGFGFAGPWTNPVKIGVLLTRCRDTVVDGVIVTHCSDAVVRFDPESARRESR